MAQDTLKRLLVWSIIGTGISSVTTQLLTIREFLTQFQGNEITISLVIFCWLLTSGLGSLAARFIRSHSLKVYVPLLFVAGIWPLLQLVVIRGLRDTFFIHGASPGFYQILVYILVIVAPYCLITGFILPCAQRTLNGHGCSFTSGDLYVADSVGDITGGFLFSLILVYFLKPFAIIAITSAMLLIVVLWLLVAYRRFWFLSAAATAVACFSFFCLNAGFEKQTLIPQYGDIVRYLESPYGRIVVSQEGGQFTFWESGNPIYSDSNIVESEEKVHYPLSQLDKVDDVLLVSGGLGETLKEIAKHKPGHLDYVEIDPALTSAGQEMGVIPRVPFLEISNMDARRFVRSRSGIYDAMIIDLPDPDTFQINRFFTREFFGFARKALKEGGILSIAMNYSPNYIGEIRRKKLSILYNSARPYFVNAMLIPGQQVYFIFSDRKLSEDIPSLLKRKKIATSYIEGYFHGDVTQERLLQVREAVRASEESNRDFKPRLMSVVFKEWFARYDSSPAYFIAGILILVLTYFAFMKKEEYILFATGFTAMGSEMLIIFVFQVLYGYIYVQIGAIITASLLGLLPGALVGKRWQQSGRLKLIVSEVAMISLLIIFTLWLSSSGTEPPPFLFLVFCFLFSFFCGFQFPVVTQIIGEEKSPAAGCLAADLCGAAVGTLATGAALIPIWGMEYGAWSLILMKLSSMAVGFKAGRSTT